MKNIPFLIWNLLWPFLSGGAIIFVASDALTADGQAACTIIALIAWSVVASELHES